MLTDPVLVCKWIDGELKCLGKRGYNFSKTDDTTVTVTINNVTESHAGVYYCVIDGNRQYSLEMFAVMIRQGKEC